MSVPSPISLLFFLMGLFVHVSSLVDLYICAFFGTLLFFSVGLFMPMPSPVSLCVCTFSGCSVVFSDRSICACVFSGWSMCLYLLLLLCCSFR